MRKERFEIVWFCLVLLNLGFVSAQNQFIDNSFNKLGEAFTSIFTPIFTLDGVSDSFLFVKVLIFILLFAVVFMTLKNIKIFKSNKPSRIIVAMIVAILAVRYLKETDFTRAILLPYGALGGAITVFLPLLIYFFFVHTSMDTGFARKAGWIIYGVIFLFLWGSQDYNTSSNWIYGSALVFVLVSFIFDKSIHVYFQIGDFQKARKKIRRERAIEIMDKIKKARNSGLDDYADELEEEYKELIKRSS